MKKLGKINELLSRSEMKQIQGGSGSGTKGYGEMCTKGSNYPQYMCRSPYSCQGSSGSIGVCR